MLLHLYFAANAINNWYFDYIFGMAAPEDNPDEPTKSWEAFLAVDSRQKQEKLSALDAFLHHFIVQERMLHSQGSTSFRQVDGVTSVLTRNFLADVHGICLESDGEDNVKLMAYLTEGRGGRILMVLKAAGIQGITCNLEFANLLLSLLAAFCTYSGDNSKLSNTCKSDDLPASEADLFPTLSLLTCTVKSRPPLFDLTTSSQKLVSQDVVNAILDECQGGESSSATLDEQTVFDLIVFIVEQLCLNDVSLASTPTLASTVLTVLADLVRASAISQPPSRPMGFHVGKKLVYLAVRDAIMLARGASGVELLLKSHICGKLVRLLKTRLDATVTSNGRGQLGGLLEEALNVVVGYVGILLSSASVMDGNYPILCKLFDDFHEFNGPELIARCLIACIEHPEAISGGTLTAVLGQVIWALGDLGSLLRKIRLHANHVQLRDRNCSRRWKWAGSLAATLASTRHHELAFTHGLLQKTSSNAELGSSGLCPVASVCRSLLAIVIPSASVSEPVAACVLSALNRCGSCCCMDVGAEVCGPVFAVLNDPAIKSSALRQLSLRLLESNLLACKSHKVALDCVSVACRPCKSRIDTEAEALEACFREATHSRKTDGFDAWLMDADRATIFSPYFDLFLMADSELLLDLERHIHALVKGTNDVGRMQLLSNVFLRLVATLVQDGQAEWDHPTGVVRLRLSLDALLCVISSGANGSSALLRAGRTVVANLCPLMVQPSLRQSVLGLLRVIMLEEVKSFGSRLTLQDAKLEPKDSLLTLYQEILIKHTLYYKDLLYAMEVKLTPSCHRPNQCPVRGSSGQGALDDVVELLAYLIDLWRSVCYLLDCSYVYRRHLWYELPTFRNVVSGTIATISRSDADNLTSMSTRISAKWDLFGYLLHVALVCAPELADRWTASLSPHLVAKLCTEDLVDSGRILQALVTSSVRVTYLNASSKCSTINNLQLDQVNDLKGEESHRVDLHDQVVLLSTWSSSDAVDDENVSIRSYERGYDADAEDEVTKRTLSSLDLVAKSKVHCDQPKKSIFRQSIACPQILKLVLKLATSYKEYLMSKEAPVQCVHILTTLFSSLVAISRGSKMDADVLQRIGSVDLILTDYEDVLESSKDLGGLKNVLLQLFVLCARRCIRAPQLKSFLRCIPHSNVPADKFLDALVELSETSRLAPTSHVQFTTARTFETSSVGPPPPHGNSFEESKKHKSLSLSSSASSRRRSRRRQDAAELARSFVVETSAAHRASALNSSWAKSLVAGSFPWPYDTPIWAQGQGLTIATWLTLNIWTAMEEDMWSSSSSSGFDKIHLVSCGSHSLTVETWFQLETKSFLVKLALSTSESYNVLDERVLRLPAGAALDDWHLLVISWSTMSVTSKRMELDVHIRLLPNAADQTSTIAPLCLVASGLTSHWKDSWSDPQRWYLLFGHRDRNNVGWSPEKDDESNTSRVTSWSLANLTVFRGSFPAQDLMATLFDLGPDTLQLDSVHVKRNADLLDDLRSARLISYSAQMPDVFTWFPSALQASSMLKTVPDYPASLLGASKVFDRCVRHIPALHFGRRALRPVSSPGTLGSALCHLGGPRLVLTLFAVLAELYPDDEQVRSSCLALIVSLNRKDRRFCSAFRTLSGWDLVMEALAHCPRASIGPRTLQALLAACTSLQVLREDLIDQKWWVDKSTIATVTNASLFSILLGSQALWSSQDEDADRLSKLLGVIEAMVSEQHPHRESNRRALKEKGVREAVVTICRERAFGSDDHCEPLSVTSCKAVVKILRSLIGPQSDSETIIETLKLLVAIHPSDLVYVCQSFYFLPQEVEQIIRPASTNSSASTPSRILDDNNGLYFPQSPDKKDNDQASSPDLVGSLPECDQELVMACLPPESFGKLTESEEEDDTDNDDHPKVNASPGKSDPAPLDGLEQEFSPSLQSKFSPAAFVRRATSKEKERSIGDLAIISKGILELLFGLDFIHVTSEVVDTDILLVLALHPDEGVRFQVLESLRTYLRRGSSAIHKHLYYLLANQLFHYEASMAIAEACFGILFVDDFTFDKDISKAPQNVVASPLVLAILPRTATDTALCHNVIATLRALCHRSSSFTKELSDYGLVQSLCLTLSAVVHIQFSLVNVYGESEQSLLVGDVNSFLQEIATHFIRIHGDVNLQIVTAYLEILVHHELIEAENHGSEALCVSAFRVARCVCLQAMLNCVRASLGWISDDDLASTGATGSMDNRSIPRSPSSFFKLIELSDAKTKPATTSEFCARFAFLLSASVDFVLFTEIVFAEQDWSFVRYLFHRLKEGNVAILNKRRLSSWTHDIPKWHSALYPLHDIFRMQFGRLLVFLLAPTQPFHRRAFVLNSVSSEDGIQADLILYTIKTNTQLEEKFRDFLRSFLEDGEWSRPELSHHEAWRSLSATLNQKARKTKPFSAVQCLESWIEASVQSKRLWRTMRSAAIKKTLKKEKLLTAVIGEAAVSVTTRVSEYYNGQCKRYLECVKLTFGRRLRLRKSWQNLAEQLTHERAIWHCPESHLSSWRLDETEGPHRVRKRLERCQLTIDQRFLMEGRRAKTKCRPRLSYLFENDEDHSNDLATLYDQLQNAEKIRCTYRSKIVTPSTETDGELLLGNRCLYFVGEQSSSIKTSSPINKKKMSEVVSHTWPFEEVKEIMKRRFLLQDNAVELFMSNGKTFIVSFTSYQNRNALFDQLMVSSLPNLVSDGDVTLGGEARLWRDQLTTNFEYLTHLNKMAGRSFNDLMQYPIFPFVLADYSSAVLDLNDIRSFRNLAKPMAIQDAKKEQHYMSQYRFLERESQMSSCSVGSGFDQPVTMLDHYGPYHYGSHYSNSGIVLHFLVRLPPFTSMFLAYQDNNFDLPDRTFHALKTSWWLSSSESTTDMKELIPEFFFLPEFLTNFEGFDFGVRQSGERVDDVVLPPWSRGDPRLFVLIHRQVLESALVTENLHRWIDLVFGYKQTGKAAIEAINVFHPATYYGFDKEQITDPLRQMAVETMVKSFGQTPVQLFRHAHPMVSLHLTASPPPSSLRNSSKPAVMPEVVGLRWGSYVGSPDESDPRIVWHKRQQFRIGSFVPMVTNEVFGLSANTALLVQYCKDKGASMINATYLTSAALIYWGHHDGLLWIQLQQDRAPQPFMAIDVSDPVTACGSTPDCLLLFLGKKSGILSIQRVSFDQSKPGVTLVGDPTELYGHSSAVLDLYLCTSYSVVVSSSADSTCIIWDLNRLCYVRSIEDHAGPVRLVTISETSGDIASISDVAAQGGSTASCLMLHTINAKRIASIRTDLGAIISSVCFSTAPEGISTNVVCAGMSDGSLRMWSSWDLLPVRTIRFDKFTRPITCLAYSLDCQHLYAANSKGFVAIFECSSKHANSVPKFRTLI